MKHMLSRREKSHTPLDDLDEISRSLTHPCPVNNNTLYCGFCLKDHETLKKENQILHAGLDAFICEGCVETLIDIKSKRFKCS